MLTFPFLRRLHWQTLYALPPENKGAFYDVTFKLWRTSLIYRSKTNLRTAVHFSSKHQRMATKPGSDNSDICLTVITRTTFFSFCPIVLRTLVYWWCDIAFKVITPVTHLLLSFIHICASFFVLLCFYLADVDGFIVTCCCHLPRFPCFIRCAHNLCQVSSPCYEICV